MRAPDVVGGQPQSALALRLVLAIFGLISCAIFAVIFYVIDVFPMAIMLVVFAFIAAVDIVVIRYRQHHRRS